MSRSAECEAWTDCRSWAMQTQAACASARSCGAFTPRSQLGACFLLHAPALCIADSAFPGKSMRMTPGVTGQPPHAQTAKRRRWPTPRLPLQPVVQATAPGPIIASSAASLATGAATAPLLAVAAVAALPPPRHATTRSGSPSAGPSLLSRRRRAFARSSRRSQSPAGKARPQRSLAPAIAAASLATSRKPARKVGAVARRAER